MGAVPELLHVAEAHVERVVVKQFVRRVNDCPDINCKHVLKLLCDLYALTKIEQDLGTPSALSRVLLAAAVASSHFTALSRAFS